ncbi:MAG: hypothetical protein ACKVPX_08530 [Myxococcaceae bacterium]
MLTLSRRSFVLGLLGGGYAAQRAASAASTASTASAPSAITGANNVAMNRWELKAFRASQARFEAVLRQEGLIPITDEDMLVEFVNDGMLVPLPETSHIRFDPYLAHEGVFVAPARPPRGRARRAKNAPAPEPKEVRKYPRQFCTPSAERFALDLGEAFARRFPQWPTPLCITSAVRPTPVQVAVVASGNKDAAKYFSFHCTGASLDIGIGGVSSKGVDGKPDGRPQISPPLPRQQRIWLRQYLTGFERQGHLFEHVWETAAVHFGVSSRYKSPA